jgi:hypothetical protein
MRKFVKIYTMEGRYILLRAYGSDPNLTTLTVHDTLQAALKVAEDEDRQCARREKVIQIVKLEKDC